MVNVFYAFVGIYIVYAEFLFRFFYAGRCKGDCAMFFLGNIILVFFERRNHAGKNRV